MLTVVNKSKPKPIWPTGDGKGSVYEWRDATVLSAEPRPANR